MPFVVDDFRGALAFGGARANLFEVQLFLPDVYKPRVDVKTQHFSFLCKGASLPASSVGVVEVPYFGRKIKMAGNRTFADWTTTVINDEDFQIRNLIEDWISAINEHAQNQRVAITSAPMDYQGSLLVNQYSKDGGVLKTYRFVHAWPSTCSDISLGWDSNDSIEEFTITWQYDYWVTEDAAGGSAAPGSTMTTDDSSGPR